MQKLFEFRAFILLVFVFVLSQPLASTTYYFDQIRGNDSHPGTSIIYPWRSLSMLQELKLLPGDSILLTANQNHSGSLILQNVRGSEEDPIVISSYTWWSNSDNLRATVDAKGFLHGILLRDCSHIQVDNLNIVGNGGKISSDDQEEISMRCGVLINTTRPVMSEDIVLSKLYISDIFFEDPGFKRGEQEVRTPNGTQSYGWGIRFINRTTGAEMRNMIVRDCVIKNVAHTGIKFTGRDHNIKHIKVYNNRVTSSGGPGIQMSGIEHGHIRGNHISYSGSKDDSRKWGRGSGLWTWGSDHVIIEHNYFMYAHGPADSAGCHIDFNCNHVVVQYNFSAHNAGGFCEILGNNRNCAYRYNISVNDGHRIKGQNDAFQEGKLFWLSGYVGRNKKRHGPYNSYFYNNTIYVSADIIAKIAVTKTAEGILIANNIFYVEGESKAVLGDQYNPALGGFQDIPNVIFKNNLFLHKDFWPEEVLVQPEYLKIANPYFASEGGTDILHYIPTNKDVIKDQGIVIPKIPSDSVGLEIGLQVKKDILNNPIQGLPDMGAIEIP